MTELIRFDQVSYRYPGGQDVLGDVSFSIAQGEMVYVTGPSGAGKSTLLRLIAALCRAQRGQIVVMGQNLSVLKPRRVPAFRQHIGLVFQNFNLLADRTVFDNVALPLVVRGYAYADIARRTRAALDALGLLRYEKSLPLTLSGGEQQRVGIARAIVTKPALILADEPTGNLDPKMAMDVMRGFARFNEAGVTVMIATHAIDLIEAVPKRIIHLERGHISDRLPTAASRLGETHGVR
ncbi:cell division ATP-binding protein FtsE [Solimonas marina]|uniref:Cell division ATP-binding protein FtsE n=1 Tax=Solimonas marina TaxID=2714601 RepID=A0A970B9A8_9GAMM|nr:cell division ATP-binding protein FtsE [Solimonas marina]NKF22221.1 cell division ATP-binding protein FtsE [Solimonas marina]